MAKQPKPIPARTLKAVAACAAVDLVYHGGTGAILIAVDRDARGYHYVKVSTTAGVTRACHWCCAQRSQLATQLTTTGQKLAAAEHHAPHLAPQFSREYTRAELALVTPSWLCDAGSENWVEVPSTDNIMAIAGIEVTS